MKHKKHRSRKPQKGSNNVVVIKFIDPILQSLLFIFFIFCLDSDSSTPYPHALLLLFALQIASIITNFFLKAEEIRIKERIIFIFCITAYIGVSWLITSAAQTSLIILFTAEQQPTALNGSIIGGAVIMLFWYFTICVREVRSMLPGMTTD